jgi:hypothetical protein
MICYVPRRHFYAPQLRAMMATAALPTTSAMAESAYPAQHVTAQTGMYAPMMHVWAECAAICPSIRRVRTAVCALSAMSAGAVRCKAIAVIFSLCCVCKLAECTPSCMTATPLSVEFRCDALLLFRDGVCTGATLVCEDGVLCTADYCDPILGCVYKPTDSFCDDFDQCTSDVSALVCFVISLHFFTIPCLLDASSHATYYSFIWCCSGLYVCGVYVLKQHSPLHRQFVLHGAECVCGWFVCWCVDSRYGLDSCSVSSLQGCPRRV